MDLVLTDQNFDEELKKETLPLLVDFYADWCGPCKLMAPVLDELAKEMAGKIVIAKLNVDENPNTSIKFGVMSIPTTIIFKDGKNVKQMVGFSGKEKLVQGIQEVVGS